MKFLYILYIKNRTVLRNKNRPIKHHKSYLTFFNIIFSRFQYL
ncbi:hypothetical protein TPE_0595 [Treponema pedis str. T A4]|uniref:Uncharacterized protein n=1 Tax=Treponema pedis str. T A4 TaxID=1291379 RepID=S6A2Z6_9SPIR|nr:hypothetical protein TPE_0595 [Treponema pedis str. T A4]